MMRCFCDLLHLAQDKSSGEPHRRFHGLTSTRDEPNMAHSHGGKACDLSGSPPMASFLQREVWANSSGAIARIPPQPLPARSAPFDMSAPLQPSIYSLP